MFIADRIQEHQAQQAQQQQEGAADMIEPWVLQFAQLFRDKTGIDLNRHADLNAVGIEKLNLALEETVTSDQVRS